MTGLHVFAARLRSLWRRGAAQNRLDEEIQAHLEMLTDEHEQQGLSREEARLRARREFGGVTQMKEAHRELRGFPMLASIVQDVRYSLRQLRMHPAFSLTAILTLALGLGANTAIFSLVYTVMLRALPVAHPEQLVELLQKYPNEPRRNGWSQASYRFYREKSHAFADIVATWPDQNAAIQMQARDDVQRMTAEYVSGNYFSELGLRTVIGRGIVDDDDPARGNMAVLSWRLWNSRFDLDPKVLGRKLLVEGKPVTIVGVAPPEFSGLRIDTKSDLWLPLQPDMQVALVARLRPDASIEQARAEMATLFRFTIDERLAADAKRARTTDPQVRKLTVELEPAASGLSLIRDRLGKPLTILMTIVAVLLLLTCVNVAAMLVARGAARAQEMALRLGLGASRGRLIRQVLTESLLLSAAGMLAGGLVAWLGTGLLTRIIASGRPMERVLLTVEPDLTLYLSVAGIAVVTGLLFGLAPAIAAIRAEPMLALRQSGRSAETRSARWFSQGLLTVQVALSVLLLSAAGVFIGQLRQLQTADLGFDRQHLLLVTLDPAQSGFNRERLSAAYGDVLDRVRAIPGVAAASLSAPTPLHGAGASGFGAVEGFAEPEANRRWISITFTAPRYFETLSIPLLRAISGRRIRRIRGWRF